jgi:putative membrane protein
MLIGHSPAVDRYDPSPLVDAAIGVTLSLFLMFRINRAYERWWEGRTLWGTLVNVSRNLAIKSRTLADLDRSERDRLREHIVGFCYGLKDHLRSEASLAGIPGFADTNDDPQHVPSYFVERIYTQLAAWRSQETITGDVLRILDRELRVFMEVAGACERIKRTLMSQSFPTLVRQALVLYLAYLPWSLVQDLGWMTVPFTIVVAYFSIGAEGIAHYVERPFGQEDDHLDLELICAGIDESVTEILAR